MRHLEQIDEDVYARISTLPGMRIYHTRAWHAFLRSVFGWRVEALVEETAAGEIKFFLPFVSKMGSSFKTGRSSLPLSHHVEPLGQASEIDDALLPISVHGACDGLTGGRDDSRVMTVLDMSDDADADAVFKRFSKSSIQRKIKKAQKSGYQLSREASPENLSAFTSMQAETRRRQGSPTFPRNFFPEMANALGDDFHMHTALNGAGEPVASIIFLDDGETSIYGYGASLDQREIWQDGVNQLVMWDAIESAFARGRKFIDFGTSPKIQPNLIQYKEKWGGISEDMPYVTLGGEGGSGVERESAAVRLVSAALKRMPLPLFERVSPLLLKIAA